MSKQSFYFPHDGNARNDDKIIAVRMRHGAEGYAVYFMILERLLESTDYMSVKDYNIIAFDLRVGAGIVKSVIEDFGLFQMAEDGRHFFAERFIERMRPLDNIREQRRYAGLKSAESRTKSKQNNDLLSKNSTTVERPLPENSTERVKESKEEIINKIPTSVGTKESADDVGSIPGGVNSISKKKVEETPPPSSAPPPSYNLTRDADGVATCQVLRAELVSYWTSNPKKYPDEMYKSFLKHWSEPNGKGVPRWYTEKTKPKGRFDLPGRLSTWNSNDLKFNGNNNKSVNRGGNQALRPTGYPFDGYRGKGNVKEIDIG